MVGTYLTLKQTFNALAGVYKKIDDGTLGEVKNRDVALYKANGSIVRLLSTFIIEPTIIISKDIREEEISEKLAEINVEIFSSFYLQAFNVLTNVYGFKSDIAFDILSSNGKVMKQDQKLAKFNLGLEEYGDNLDILPIKKSSINYISQEGQLTQLQKKRRQELMDKRISSSKAGSASARDNKGVALPTLIQKEIEINQRIVNGTGAAYDIVIPVTIKATVIYSDFSNIETMISTNDKAKGLGSRLDEYRAGMISIGDLIFADDLVKEYKNNKLKDKDSLINYMESRATAANKKILTDGHIGLSKFYSTLIVTKNQMAIIENKLGGSISKPKYREMLMQQTKSLLINVVDTDWERVEIHTKDLKGTSNLSYKVINKKKGGTDSSDLADVFKAITSNKPPVF